MCLTHACSRHMHVPIAHIYIPSPPPPPPPPPQEKNPVLNPDHAKTSRSQLWILSLYLTHYNYSCHHKPHEHLIMVHNAMLPGIMVHFDSIASTNNAMYNHIKFCVLPQQIVPCVNYRQQAPLQITIIHNVNKTRIL